MILERECNSNLLNEKYGMNYQNLTLLVQSIMVTNQKETNTHHLDSFYCFLRISKGHQGIRGEPTIRQSGFNLKGFGHCLGKKGVGGNIVTKFANQTVNQKGKLL